MSVEEHQGEGGAPVDAREALIAFLPYARKKAGDLAGGDAHLKDDLIQEGMIGLYNGIGRFRPERGSFAGFACSCIRNRMISYLRRIRRYREQPETMPEHDRPIWDVVERNDLFERLLERLTPLETAALDAFCVAGGCAQAARLLGWPYKRMENALSRIRTKAWALWRES
ncbi:MAG: sigma-70 family RNA polymerase sigma factor [Synergistales bacterium]|nr:sigma-70 family RNA polymerase sigma factor [Synergistales bacterium]